MDAAWAAFAAACPESLSREEQEGQWFRILAKLFPGKPVEEFTPDDWGLVRVEAPGKVVPF